MDIKENLNLESIVFEKENTTVDDITSTISNKYNIQQFDLECEVING